MNHFLFFCQRMRAKQAGFWPRLQKDGIVPPPTAVQKKKKQQKKRNKNKAASVVSCCNK